MMSRAWYLLGLFLLCAGVLMAQIAFTRLLSVLFFFHLAFFSISMAMLGLTAGAVGVYWLEKKKGPLELGRWLPQMCVAFAMGMVVAVAMVTSVRLLSLAAMLLVIGGMVVPYLCAGVAVSLALTRSPYPVGLTYGADLLGAALGCLLALVLLNCLMPIEALLVVAGMGVLAAGCFARAAGRAMPNFLVGLVVLGTMVVLQSGMPLFQLVSQKKVESSQLEIDYRGGNAYSYITVLAPYMEPYFYWGAAKDAPKTEIQQRFLQIDGLAGTPMYSYSGLEGYGFLKYDVTNLAYTIRHEGRSAVIGIGGGRDLAAARHFGFAQVTGVELNPIFVRLLTEIEPYASFAGIGRDPGVQLVVDDGRSWFARTQEKFDLIQMSMVDTWAATGAGNFTLSENGLYTLEGWRHFVQALRPEGVLTVSRWYAPQDVNETGRMIALAVATLQSLGVAEPRAHLYVAGTDRLATLILSPAPFSAADIRRLDAESAARGYRVLVHPGKPAASAVLEEIVSAVDAAALQAFTSAQFLDLTPSTDNRPFFFNQLKLGSLFSVPGGAMRMIFKDRNATGVVSGNLLATVVVLLIVFLSALFVMGLLIVPAIGSLAGVAPQLGWLGSLYFLAIGLGFMFVEIGTIQRMSVFLGHPIYSLAIVLFSLILATGVGSLISDRLRLSVGGLTRWLGALVVLLGAVALAGSGLTARFESEGLLVRALVTVGLVTPPALLMGFAFPFGLRLTGAIDTRPAPWFWGVNGAAGVLASGLAVLCSIHFSITVTLVVGAACYLFLLVPALRLQRLAQK